MLQKPDFKRYIKSEVIAVQSLKDLINILQVKFQNLAI